MAHRLSESSAFQQLPGTLRMLGMHQAACWEYLDGSAVARPCIPSTDKGSQEQESRQTCPICFSILRGTSDFSLSQHFWSWDPDSKEAKHRSREYKAELARQSHEHLPGSTVERPPATKVSAMPLEEECILSNPGLNEWWQSDCHQLLSYCWKGSWPIWGEILSCGAVQLEVGLRAQQSV